MQRAKYKPAYLLYTILKLWNFIMYGILQGSLFILNLASQSYGGFRIEAWLFSFPHNAWTIWIYGFDHDDFAGGWSESMIICGLPLGMFKY